MTLTEVFDTDLLFEGKPGLKLNELPLELLQQSQDTARAIVILMPKRVIEFVGTDFEDIHVIGDMERSYASRFVEGCLLSQFYENWDFDYLRPLALDTRSGSEIWLHALALAISRMDNDVDKAKLEGMFSIAKSFLTHLWYRLLPPIDATAEIQAQRDKEFF